MGKQVRLPFKAGIHKSQDMLEYIYSDLWGLAPVPTVSGYRSYFLTIDDYSRKVGFSCWNIKLTSLQSLRSRIR